MINPLNLSSRLGCIKSEIDEDLPLGVKDQNTTIHERTGEKDNERKAKKQDNYDNLGLAANLIQNILSSIEPNPNMQLAVLQECMLNIDSSDTLKSSKTGSANLKLRRSMRKFSHKENSSLQYDVTMSHIQDLFKPGF
mmetsp:Transcript_31115/g.27518  ORF Transcript_31115/g.27518 Transcript_31115/m.27518 type:complete len:138 (+) Transcript_31115:1485-1898(+)